MATVHSPFCDARLRCSSRLLDHNQLTGSLPKRWCDSLSSLSKCEIAAGNSLACGSLCESGAGPCDLSTTNCFGCTAGTYSDPKEGIENGQPICRGCPTDKVANCHTNGLKVQSLELKAGFYRHTQNDDYIGACPYDSKTACPGGRGNATGEDICGASYSSVLCAVCSEGNFFIIDQCQRCSAFRYVWVGIIGGVTAAVAAVVALALRNHTVRAFAEYLWSSLGTQSKIVWSGAQILSGFPSLLFGLLPNSLQHFYSSFLVTNLNLSSLTAVECFQSVLASYLTRLILTTSIPVVLAVTIWVARFVRMRSASEDRSRIIDSQHSRLFLLLCYLTLPSVCTVTFSAFQCEQYLSSGVSFMRADFGTSCNSTEYRDVVLPWATVCVIIFPLGVNIMYAVVLFRHRAAIQKGKAEGIAFLHHAYSDRAWFWEPIDSLRRITLTGGLVFLSSDSSRIVAAVLLGFFWVLVYFYFPAFDRKDDQKLAEMMNSEILFTALMLSFSQGELIGDDATAGLCIVVNLCILPAIAFFQLQNARRGWHIVKSLEPGAEINESFHEEWLMRCWDAGGSAREFIRGKLVAWLEHALRSPIDTQTCSSILCILQLSPFQDIDAFGVDGMGIICGIEEEIPSFAVLASALAIEETNFQSSNSSSSNPLYEMKGGRVIDGAALEQQQEEAESSPNARLRVINGISRIVDCYRAPGDFVVQLGPERQRVQFEAVLLYALQRLIEEGHTGQLLEYVPGPTSPAHSWYPTKYEVVSDPTSPVHRWYPSRFPLHFLVQSQHMTPALLAKLISEVGPMALLKLDEAGHYPFYYLKYRWSHPLRGSKSVARTDERIANLVLGVIDSLEGTVSPIVKKDMVQLLLQQAVAHSFVGATRQLIEKCGGKLDDASAFDSRTPRMIRNSEEAQRAFDGNSEEAQQRASDVQFVHKLELKLELDLKLDHIFKLEDREKKENRRRLFRETMGDAQVPFTLPAGDLQAWLRIAMADGKATSSTEDLVNSMGDVNGMIVLDSWVVVSFLSTGDPNHGKLSKEAVSETLPNTNVKMAALSELARYLGLERMQYYKAILLSCEKRSLLTDLDHIKFIGRGTFGRFATSARYFGVQLIIHCALARFVRAHLCRNRYSKKNVVIKLIMPREGQHSRDFVRAVKETELQQRLGNSEFVASVFSWGTIDSVFLWVCMEFCDGGSLASVINKDDTIDRAKPLWCKQLALGLKYMHDLRIMHRDIKPVRPSLPVQRSTSMQLV